MHTHTYTHIHTSIHTYIHPYIHTYVHLHAYVNASMHAYVPTYIPASRRICMHLHTYTEGYTHIHTCIPTAYTIIHVHHAYKPSHLQTSTQHPYIHHNTSIISILHINISSRTDMPTYTAVGMKEKTC